MVNKYSKWGIGVFEYFYVFPFICFCFLNWNVLCFCCMSLYSNICIKHCKYQSKPKEVDIWGGYHIYIYIRIIRDSFKPGTMYISALFAKKDYKCLALAASLHSWPCEWPHISSLHILKHLSLGPAKTLVKTHGTYSPSSPVDPN